MGLFRRKWFFIPCIISLCAIGIWLTIELHHPTEIVSTHVTLPGIIKALASPGLTVQHVCQDGMIWAVKGYWVYKAYGNSEFRKAFRLPSGNLLSSLGNSHSFRRVTGHTELCEVFPLRSRTILGFSGGYIWRSTDDGNTWQLVHRLRHFGIGQGRGVMPQGIAEDDDGAIYYGQYFRNWEHDSVFVYRSMDDGKNWEIVYQFNPGEIRHIHSLQFDPYTKTLWIATGDRDSECMIGYSTDKRVNFQKIGSGSQRWRAVSLLFTEEAVFWGTDSPENQNWIYRWDRETQDVKQICEVDGPIYYSTKLSDGTLIMGSAAEGGAAEWDELVSLWVSKEGERWKRVILGTRKSPKKAAAPRFSRGRHLPDLYTTLLNIHDHEEVLLQIPSRSLEIDTF
jgi:hypothetical protein